MAEDNFIGGLGSVAKGFNSGDISSIFSSPVFGKIYFFMKVGLGMAVGLGVLAIIYKYYLQYKIRVTIHKKIGNGGDEVIYDMAKEVEDNQGKRKIQTFKLRKPNKQPVSCPVPEAMFKGKKGKSDHYELWLDDNWELHPIEHPKCLENQEYLKVVPQERAAWARLEKENLFKKYMKKDKLMQYAAPAILMTACITAFLIFFFASKELGNGMADLASTFRQIASSCTQLGG